VTTRATKKNIIMAFWLSYVDTRDSIGAPTKSKFTQKLKIFTTPKSTKKSTQPEKRVKQQQKKIEQIFGFPRGPRPGGEGGKARVVRLAAWYSKPGKTVTTTHKQESPIRSSPV
jgi:hypothetical protein